jgi:tetratricopeptide (TPR) repeat protein
MSGHYDEVIQLIGSDMPFSPEDVNLFWWRGVARHHLKQCQDALMDLERAVALADCDAVVHTTRADVLANLKRFPEALAAAEKAAEIEPDGSEHHFLVGWYAYCAGELTKSTAASRRSLELNPKQPIAEFNLGLALLASGQSTDAMEAYHRGIHLCAELDQENALAVFNGAFRDLDALISNRPEIAVLGAEAKARLKEACDARMSSGQ